MARTFIPLLLVCGLSLTAPAAEPIPPQTITLDGSTKTLATVAAAIARQTDLALDLTRADGTAACNITAEKLPLWATLERIAKATGHHLVPGKLGRTIRFVKAAGSQFSSCDGPFRIVARTVTARRDLETGLTTYSVTLDIHWEPRLPVFRIDAQPRIATATDERGTALTAVAASGKNAIAADVSSLETTEVKLEGLTRAAAKLATLEGEFTVTASPAMLAFAFDDLTAKLPVAKEQKGITVTLSKFEPAEGRWDAEVALKYPAGHPEFESFESWADGNRLRLVAPDKTRTFPHDNFDIGGSGRSVRANYRFLAEAGKGPQLGDRVGWSLVYETPAPLVEFPVKFKFRDIPLP